MRDVRMEPLWQVCGCVAAWGACLACTIGCGDAASPPKEPAETAAGSAAKYSWTETQRGPQSKPATAVDPFHVPENAAPSELINYIRRVDRQYLSSSASLEELRRHHQRKQDAIIAAADKILASQAPPVFLLQAAKAKVVALAHLAVLKVDGARDKMFAFAREAVPLGERYARESLDEVLHREAALLKLKALYVLTDDEKAPAVDALLAYATEAKKDRDGEVKREAYGAIMTLHLNRLRAGRELDPGAILDEVTEQLRESAADAATMESVLGVLRQLEGVGQIDAAVAVHRAAYARFVPAELPGKPTPRDGEEPILPPVSQLAKVMLDAIGKRLNIVGQSLPITGRLAGGGEFDWNRYRGRVVLVHFFTTWTEGSGAVGGEGTGAASAAVNTSWLPELKSVYQQRRQQGLAIVGVSLDKVASDISEFISRNQVPWPVIANLPGTSLGAKDPNAERCGLENPPLLVLFDRDGRVVLYGFWNTYFQSRLTKLLEEPKSR